MSPRRRSYSTDELTEVAEGLRRILETIKDGSLSADAGTINRLEGAAAALEALGRGESPKLI
jgi:hypothetical protein